MKLAAVHALAELAREEVPDDVKKAYDDPHLKFGPSTSFPSRSIIGRSCELLLSPKPRWILESLGADR